MGVELGPSFDPGFEGIPPHISTDDLVLWHIFRKRHAKEYVKLYFDVALGSGEDSPENTRPSVAAAWKRLTQFRADVVGDTGSEWHLIELRPNAGPGAIGAIQTYSTLWLTEPPDDRPLKPMVVTDRCSADIRKVAALAGVEIRCLSESA